MVLIKMQIANSKIPSVLFDPDLPTAKEVMVALCCVATQYAQNPSYDLAKTALTLSGKLLAPEYADTKLIVEIANRMIKQWSQVLREHLDIEAQLVPAINTIQ
jgi:hypothetical protein